MRDLVTIDFETKSYCDVKAAGAWRYSEDPTTDIICVCWGFRDWPIRAWVPGMDPPIELFDFIDDGFIMEAHNVAFERSVWTNVLAKRYGWRLPSGGQWADTMASAAYYSLPLSLDRLASALGFEGKDAEGSKLITKYSKLYLKNATPFIPENVLWNQWVPYCKRDVQVEQSVSDLLGELPDREQPVYELYQRVSMRGLLLDVPGIEAATAIVDQRAEEMADRFRKLVGFNPTQRDKVLGWLRERGLKIEALRADDIDEILEAEGDDALPQGEVREALTIRRKISKASTKKLDAMARQVGSDGRARFQTKYHGANTGRETGTGIQPLNFVRGFDPPPPPEQLVADIMHRDAKWLDFQYGDAIDAVSKSSRHWIRASDGSEIGAGDFVSVEAVVLACLAKERWKIEAFRQRVGIYELTACKIYGYPLDWANDKKWFKEHHGPERQDGKTCELAFGYQGSLGAYLKFDDSGRRSDAEILDMNRKWRGEHPRTKAMWSGLEIASLKCVRSGERTEYEGIAFEIVDEGEGIKWLTMILPDGKRLWYFKPEIRMGMPAWHKPKEEEECANGTCDHKPVPKLSYMSQKEGQWKRVYTYGGKLTENLVQATSRQILEAAKHRIAERWDPELRAMGYLGPDQTSIILSVYDEIVCEYPKGYKTKEEIEKIMSEPAGDWCKDWPINCDAWVGARYKK